MDRNLLLTYADYQKERDPFTMEDMIRIHEEFAKSMSARTDDDQEAERLFRKTLEKAREYTVEYRFPWFTKYDQEKRNSEDEVRTRVHNAFLRSLEDIKYFQEDKGISTEWYDLLGDPAKHRKRIGDFACYLIFIAAVNGR